MNQYRCETCEHMKTHTSKGGLPFEERCEVSGYPPRDKIFENKLACVGCASHSDFQSERDKVLEGRKLYRCNSDTCSDSGGVCILCIPDMDFASPTSCVNPETFTDNGDEPDCKWEELRQAGEP